MAVKVSNKLNNAFEGALAGGGDPATSPLYVFGPFLKLIVVAGVAKVTFGASLWMVIITIMVVSAMYRLVMRWVTDGSGGSGLSEEEFGSWAVKVNAAITFVEYTLTFLVSMAAMVTFIADRLPVLNQTVFGIQYRTFVAISLSVLTGWLVNRGPKMAARTFGPATAGVLILLWVMIGATLWQRGFHFPDFNLAAFQGEYFHFTLAGYVRILAVMTGIEVFANLVAAYEGSDEVRSRRAFNSLLIIMGTTAATMLIVGPAIMEISDPTNLEVSVFTQTMDVLLPSPLPILGTIVGIAVLMSASAASAQGLQNLALGLKKRNYIPPTLGQQNQFDVADKPVWLEVAIVSIAFMFFGTNEETYLALYAAGVFILLSMTGWAVTKRLIRQTREEFSLGRALIIPGTTIAAILTTGATAIIFEERFTEGAWTYLLFIPIFYIGFSISRAKLGEPDPVLDYLGGLDTALLAGFGFGQMAPAAVTVGASTPTREITWDPEPIEGSNWRKEYKTIRKIAVLLDGSVYAAQALPAAKRICQATGASMTLLSGVKSYSHGPQEQFNADLTAREIYLDSIIMQLKAEGYKADKAVRVGSIAEVTQAFVESTEIDLVVTTTRGKSGEKHWMSGGVSSKLMVRLDIPVYLVQGDQPTDLGRKPEKILVALDGSIASEKVLPYARTLAQTYNSEITLLSVPQIPETENYRAPADVVENLRAEAEAKMRNFLEAVARSLENDGIKTNILVKGSRPATTILETAEEDDYGLIMLTSNGRGAFPRMIMGADSERVVGSTNRCVLMMPSRNNH
ncbi:MAG: universal stress protein [Anaerolineales bacterium]|nr:universal stress protein [Anaerolineales bacterium]